MEHTNPSSDNLDPTPHENKVNEPTAVRETTPEVEQRIDTDVVDETVPREVGTTAMINLGIYEPVTVEKKTLPPIDSIPSLFECGVKGPDSIHRHKYDPANTVWTRVCAANDTPRSEQTPEQVELLGDVERLATYAPNTSGYMDVFTPSELHDIVGKLELLRQKNRPDFNSFEEKIIDVVLRNKDGIDSGIVGIAKRAEGRAEGRRGMQWSTLNKLAGAEMTHLLRLCSEAMNVVAISYQSHGILTMTKMTQNPSI